MKVKELIEKLKCFDQDAEIVYNTMPLCIGPSNTFEDITNCYAGSYDIVWPDPVSKMSKHINQVILISETTYYKEYLQKIRMTKELEVI